MATATRNPGVVTATSGGGGAETYGTPGHVIHPGRHQGTRTVPQSRSPPGYVPPGNGKGNYTQAAPGGRPPSVPQGHRGGRSGQRERGTRGPGVVEGGCGAPPSTPAEQSAFAPGNGQQEQQQPQQAQVPHPSAQQAVYAGRGGESQPQPPHLPPPQQPAYPRWGGESQFLPNQGGPAVMGTGGQGGFWTPGGASGGEEGQPLPSRDSEENRGLFGGLFR